MFSQDTCYDTDDSDDDDDDDGDQVSVDSTTSVLLDRSGSGFIRLHIHGVQQIPEGGYNTQGGV